jgi:hypothetical protein
MNIETVLSPGKHFSYNGIEFVCLNISDDKMLAITAKIIETMEFSNIEFLDDDCENVSNNWKQSVVRAWLNEEFIKCFDKDDLIIQTSDLNADDKQYGTCEDYITLLSYEQYETYRDIIPHYNVRTWTVTPWLCIAPDGYIVRHVYPSGDLDYYNAYYEHGLAPVCLFNLDHAKNIKLDYTDEIKEVLDYET